MPTIYTNKVVYDGDVLIDLTSDTATAADVLASKTFHLKSGAPATGTIATKTSSNLTLSGATFTAPAGYYASAATKTMPYAGDFTLQQSIDGAGTSFLTATNTGEAYQIHSSAEAVTGTEGYVSADTSWIAEEGDIRYINVQSKTVTPTAAGSTVSPDTGKLLSSVIINGDSDLTAVNVKTGVKIFGVTGTFTSDANAVAGNILSGKTAYVNGSKVTGSIATLDANDVTVSGATVTIPLNYYTGATGETAVTKTISSGALGTPSISVNATTGVITATSSVSTAGYLATSATKNGTLTLSSTQDADFVAANIRAGKTIFGLTGTMSATEGLNLQDRTVTLTSTGQSFTFESDYNGLNTITVNPYYSSTANNAGGNTVIILQDVAAS